MTTITNNPEVRSESSNGVTPKKKGVRFADQVDIAVYHQDQACQILTKAHPVVDPAALKSTLAKDSKVLVNDSKITIREVQTANKQKLRYFAAFILVVLGVGLGIAAIFVPPLLVGIVSAAFLTSVPDLFLVAMGICFVLSILIASHSPQLLPETPIVAVPPQQLPQDRGRKSVHTTGPLWTKDREAEQTKCFDRVFKDGAGNLHPDKSEKSVEDCVKTLEPPSKTSPEENDREIILKELVRQTIYDINPTDPDVVDCAEAISEALVINSEQAIITDILQNALKKLEQQNELQETIDQDLFSDLFLQPQQTRSDKQTHVSREITTQPKRPVLQEIAEGPENETITKNQSIYTEARNSTIPPEFCNAPERASLTEAWKKNEWRKDEQRPITLRRFSKGTLKKFQQIIQTLNSNFVSEFHVRANGILSLAPDEYLRRTERSHEKKEE